MGTPLGRVQNELLLFIALFRGQVINAYSCWWRLPALVAFICYIHTCFLPFKNFDSLMFIQLFKKAQISIWVCRKSVCMVYSIINHEVLFQCFLLFRFFWQAKQLAAIREATEARVVLVLFFLFIKNIVCDLVEKRFMVWNTIVWFICL